MLPLDGVRHCFLAAAEKMIIVAFLLTKIAATMRCTERTAVLSIESNFTLMRFKRVRLRKAYSSVCENLY